MVEIQSTSLEAFESIQPVILRKREIVLKAIQFLGSCTNNEISDYLDWQINRVTGRVNELVKKGLVKESGRRPCSVTKYMAITWKHVVMEGKRY